jgi:hypothetical protein
MTRAAHWITMTLLWTGCLEPLEDVAISDTEQSITAMGYWGWSTTNNHVNNFIDLGGDYDRTCFLQGITGQLVQADPTEAYQKREASVRVYNTNGGRWWLRLKSGSGTGVMAYATCIPEVKNRRTLRWTGNTGKPDNNFDPFIWTHRSATTQCFLTALWGTVGWTSPNSHVELVKTTHDFGDGPIPIWRLTGDLVKWGGWGNSGGGAEAVCVDFAPQSTAAYGLQVSNGGGATAPLVPESESMCAIHKVAGDWSSWFGWNAGATLVPDSVSGSCGPNGCYWNVFSSYARGIYGECLFDTRRAPAPEDDPVRYAPAPRT